MEPGPLVTITSPSLDRVDWTEEVEEIIERGDLMDTVDSGSMVNGHQDNNYFCNMDLFFLCNYFCFV